MCENVINEFKEENRFLSNFYQCDFVYEGLTYHTAEAAFQAQKTLEKTDRKVFTQLAPAEAKRRGRHVRLRDDWEEIKDGIMEEIVRAKFSQNPKLKAELLATGEAQLIEGNTWNDRYWGVDVRSGIGKNHLGKILMKVRSELKK